MVSLMLNVNTYRKQNKVQMILKIIIILVLVALLSAKQVDGATKNTKLVQFRPITRDEYNEILKLTNGKNTISEARLIQSGLAVLKNLATYTTSLWPNFWSVFGITQPTTANLDLDDSNSYPLCVVSNDDDDEANDGYENVSNSMDCIIVVRKNQNDEHEEVEAEDGPYYDDTAPLPMLPDYAQYPYAPQPLPLPPLHHYNPYAYSYYAPYPAYNYHHLQPQFSQPQSMEFEAENQQQHQNQGDYYHQPNYLHYAPPHAPPPHNFFYAPNPHSQMPSNAGPIVHVIRGDQREFNQQRRLSVKRPTITKNQRPRMRAIRRALENGYKKTTIAKQQYNTADSYPKMSLTRSMPYEGPVYLMTAEKLMF